MRPRKILMRGTESNKYIDDIFGHFKLLIPFSKTSKKKDYLTILPSTRRLLWIRPRVKPYDYLCNRSIQNPHSQSVFVQVSLARKGLVLLRDYVQNIARLHELNQWYLNSKSSSWVMFYMQLLNITGSFLKRKAEMGASARARMRGRARTCFFTLHFCVFKPTG